MTPTKIRTLIPEVAKELNMEEDKLLKLVNFFYKELRISMENLDHLKFEVVGLGNFKMKGWDIEKQLEKHKQHLKGIKNKIPNAHPKDLEKDIENFERILLVWEGEVKKEQEVVKKRAEFYNEIENIKTVTE